MKQQIIFIHGGEAYSNYDVFLECLKNEVIDPFEIHTKRWHQKLPVSLGETYEVFLPKMPNPENAKYLEWKIWFEKYIPFLHDEVILIGHSQGGYFLAKYLTENMFSISIKALYLVSAPFEPDDFGGEDGGDFRFDTTQLSKLQENIPRIVIFHSTDDYVVPYSHALKYKEQMLKAELRTFEDRVHFWQEEFPELVADIKRLG